MKAKVKYTSEQIKAAVDLGIRLKQQSDNPQNTMNLRSFKTYYSPVDPLILYVKYRVVGVESGEMYDDTEVIAIERDGSTHKPEDQYKVRNEFLTFLSNLYEIKFEDGKPVFV